LGLVGSVFQFAIFVVGFSGLPLPECERAFPPSHGRIFFFTLTPSGLFCFFPPLNTPRVLFFPRGLTFMVQGALLYDFLTVIFPPSLGWSCVGCLFSLFPPCPEIRHGIGIRGPRFFGGYPGLPLMGPLLLFSWVCFSSEFHMRVPPTCCLMELFKGLYRLDAAPPPGPRC